jgi:hypothetical protein
MTGDAGKNGIFGAAYKKTRRRLWAPLVAEKRG